MMNIIRKYTDLIKKDEVACRRLFIISLITALFILALAVQKPAGIGTYIVNGEGDVTGIERGSRSSSEVYDMQLTIIDGDAVSEQPVRINIQAVKPNNSASESGKSGERIYERDAEINSIISEIELSKEKTIVLPDALSDGTKLKWSTAKSNSTAFIIIPFVYLFLVVLIAKDSIDSSTDVSRKQMDEIVRGLPRFTNQLLLIMNAGMILSDAITWIANGYDHFHDENSGYFESEMIRLAQTNRDHRSSTANMLSEFAGEHNVKELMRIATILTENERRGSDIIDNLDRESRYLWEDRKIKARERGKMIDTRMSYPLAILLLLLIVITMTPALLNL